MLVQIWRRVALCAMSVHNPRLPPKGSSRRVPVWLSTWRSMEQAPHASVVIQWMNNCYYSSMMSWREVVPLSSTVAKLRVGPRGSSRACLIHWNIDVYLLYDRVRTSLRLDDPTSTHQSDRHEVWSQVKRSTSNNNSVWCNNSLWIVHWKCSMCNTNTHAMMTCHSRDTQTLATAFLRGEWNTENHSIKGYWVAQASHTRNKWSS